MGPGPKGTARDDLGDPGDLVERSGSTLEAGLTGSLPPDEGALPRQLRRFGFPPAPAGSSSPADIWRD